MVESVIAIKDFEMPESCWECGVADGLFGELRCDLLGGLVDDAPDNSRHESCPLVEIPDHVG